MNSKPKVALFRPDDHRMEKSTSMLRDRGYQPIPDPLLEPKPTGSQPRRDADYLVLTSVTGVEIVFDGRVRDIDAELVVIGPKTADAVRSHGVEVDLIPDTYSSAGLVEELRGRVEGKRVEVARSDHGSPQLPDGLNDAGAYVHETTLYELEKPQRAGEKTMEALRQGEVDALLFTSSLIVDNLAEMSLDNILADLLEDVVVAAIGEPTQKQIEQHGFEATYVAPQETFRSMVDELDNHL